VSLEYLVDKNKIIARADYNIDCLYCKHSVIYSPQFNARNDYHINYHLVCQPKEQKYQDFLRKYFKEHNIKKLIGYISLIVESNGAYLYIVKRKTNPKWCPKNIVKENK
jgi:hypothetical protein